MDVPIPVKSNTEADRAKLIASTDRIEKLQLIEQDLKRGILASLWQDEPAGGFGKILPLILQIASLILLIIIVIKN